MKFGDLNRDDIDRFADHRLGEWPPQLLYKAARSLAGDEKITHGIGHSSSTDGDGTKWQLFALTDTRLIWIIGSIADTNWHWQSETKHVPDLQATAHPLRNIESISVTGVKDIYQGLQDYAAWSADFKVTFTDGTIIVLPEATKASNQPQRDSIEEFTAAIISGTSS